MLLILIFLEKYSKFLIKFIEKKIYDKLPATDETFTMCPKSLYFIPGVNTLQRPITAKTLVLNIYVTSSKLTLSTVSTPIIY